MFPECNIPSETNSELLCGLCEVPVGGCPRRRFYVTPKFHLAPSNQSKVESLPTMSKQPINRLELLQGTLDMLILRTLFLGPAHGHQIAKHIQRTSDAALKVEHGSLYPALHRLERKGWLAAKWETVPPGKREFKYYRLTPSGRKQLASEESKWKQLAKAIAKVMWPTTES